jgi:hypothetical protein
MARGKKPKTDAPEVLDYEARKMIWAWVKTEYPQYANGETLRQMWNRCRTWYQARGVQFSDWPAAFEGWIVMAYERDTQQTSHGLRGAALSRHVEAVAKRNSAGLEVIAGGLGRKA